MSYKKARGVLPWKPGDETAEQTIARIRGHDDTGTDQTIERATIAALRMERDHATGEIRGLLCLHCNRILGLMHDDPEMFRKAASYLDVYKQ